MIAINPLFDKNEKPELRDCGPMLVGCSDLLGEGNDSLCVDDDRNMSIAMNALLHKAQDLASKKDVKQSWKR